MQPGSGMPAQWLHMDTAIIRNTHTHMTLTKHTKKKEKIMAASGWSSMCYGDWGGGRREREGEELALLRLC